MKSVNNNLKVSFYNRVSENEGKEVLLSEVLKDIKSEKYIRPISRVRNEVDKDKRSNIKKSRLPVFTICGEFHDKRRANAITKYNKLIVLDFDDVVKEGESQTERLAEFRAIVSKIMYTYCYFVSPSGNGFKVIVEVDSELEDHGIAFEQVAKYYEEQLKKDFGIEVDPSGKDVSRLCYVSSDNFLEIRDNATVFEVENIIPVSPVKLEITELRDSANEQLKQNESNDDLSILDEIVNYCEENEKSITYDYMNWSNVSLTIGGLELPVESKINYFLRLCRLDGKNHEEKASKRLIENSIKQSRGELKIGTLIHYAQKVGYTPMPKNAFWYECEKTKDVYGLKINNDQYLNWLSEEGFFFQDGKLYQKENYLIDEKSTQDLKLHIINFMKGLPEKLTKNCTKNHLVNTFLDQHYIHTSNKKLEFLSPEKIELHRDTPHKVYFYFRNGMVEVTKDKIQLKSYSELDQCVFKNQIIDAEIKNFEMDGSSNYLNFLNNITDDGSIINSVGGMLSRCKRDRKAFVFLDADANKEEANGGRGKTLVVKGVEQMRNVVTIDGRTCRDDHFLFQKVTLETDIVLMDDLREDFRFDKLFSATVTDLNVEPRYSSSFSIPFALSPKFVITTNHPLDGLTGSSARRRKHVVKFNDYYSEKWTPMDEFDKEFFSSESTADEMEDFYNTMFYCVQVYLKEGLGVSAVGFEEGVSIKRDTCQDFYNYMEALDVVSKVSYDVAELYEDFVEIYPKYIEIDTRRFFKWVRLFILYKGWTTKESLNTNGEKLLRKSNGRTYLEVV